MNPIPFQATLVHGQFPPPLAFIPELGGILLVVMILIGGGLVYLLLTCYRKVEKGRALVRTGGTRTKVILNGGFVVPVIHRSELIDISVKRIEIDRTGKTD